jgi:signal transduction histidine kinase
LKNFFRKIIREFVRQHHLKGVAYGEYNRIVITLYFTILAIIGIFIYAILDYYSGNITFVISDLIFLIIFFLNLLLMQEGLFVTARYILIINTICALAIGGFSQGREAGNYMIFFPLSGLVFMIFSLKQWKHITILMSILILSLITMEITDYKLLKLGEVSTDYQLSNHYITLASSLFLTTLLVYNLTKLNHQAEFKLDRMNVRLNHQNKELMKANKELDSFVYKASHDLRAPLTSILGLINISKNEDDHNKIKEYIHLQEKAVQKLDSYIQQILYLSRNARTAIVIEKVQLKDLIEAGFTQLSYMKQAGIIRHEIILNSESEFHSDSKRLAIIFNNLISNCYHYFSPHKDQPEIKIQIRIDHDNAYIDITDNGLGIDSRHLPKIFDMFYRGSEQPSGSGLGLYIVMETLKMLKGEIKVTSEKNSWTTFSLKIPNSR